MIPCYVEGPENPGDGWANVHIDGLGNESVTISIWSDRIILAQFGHALGSRKMRSDWAYSVYGRRLEKPLHEPDCIEWAIKFALKMILEWGSCMYNCYDREEKIRRLNIKSKYTPATMLLGRPYYLI